jgi:hypothetical protein
MDNDSDIKAEELADSLWRWRWLLLKNMGFGNLRPFCAPSTPLRPQHHCQLVRDVGSF